MDEESIRELVELWFAALANRRAEVLVGMTTENVEIRPFLARQTPDAVTYRGHDGVRRWVESLDAQTRITLDLKRIEISGELSAIVEAEVWMQIGDSRTGGMTWSVWRFEDGKLAEAVGYGSMEDARDAERRTIL